MSGSDPGAEVRVLLRSMFDAYCRALRIPALVDWLSRSAWHRALFVAGLAVYVAVVVVLSWPIELEPIPR